MGTLMKKTHSQPRPSVTAPPIRRPDVAPTPPMPPQIENEVIERELLGGRAVAAQQRANARAELRVERLEQVVVRARVEAGDALLERVARREQEDRHAEPLPRTRRVTARPSTPGIATSRTMRSGIERSTPASAAPPSATAVTS